MTEIVVGQIETMGSLAKPSVVAQCSASGGLSVEEPYADFTHSMRTMINLDGVHEKSAPQSETNGCLVVSSMEKVGIGLGPKQSEAHLVYNLSPMTTSPGFSEAGNCSKTYSGPFSSTFTPDGSGEKPTVFPSCLVMPVEMSRSDFEGSFSVSQSLEALQVESPSHIAFLSHDVIFLSESTGVGTASQWNLPRNFYSLLEGYHIFEE